MLNVRNNNRDAYSPLAAVDSYLCCFLVNKVTLLYTSRRQILNNSSLMDLQSAIGKEKSNEGLAEQT